MTSRTYFLHVPKTAGITLKAYLENQFDRNDVLAIDQKVARTLPPSTLNAYRFWSGHYDASVLAALDPAPSTVLVVRDPVARLRSWVAHGRRLRDPKLHAPFAGTSVLDVARHNIDGHARQAFWVARALVPGWTPARLPEVAELDGLLDRVSHVGLTEELDRTLLVLAFHLGGALPPIGWRLNQRTNEASDDRESPEERDELRALLSLDTALYERASARFWTAYGRMLETIAPAGARDAVSAPARVPVTTAREWLAAWRRARQRTAPLQWTTAFRLDGDDPQSGDGWWWREHPGQAGYRWTGAEGRTTIDLGALSPALSYSATIDICGAADWPTWDRWSLELNGQPLPVVRTRVPLPNDRSVSLRATATLPAHAVAAAGGPSTLTIVVPEPHPVPGAPLLHESQDTVRRDVRHVGLAVQRVEVVPHVSTPVSTAVQPAPGSPAEAGALARYLDEGYHLINGWLHPSAVDVTLALGRLLRQSGMTGPVLEIGVWQGRYLSLLSFLGRADQPLVAVDPFVHVPERARQIATLRENLARYAWRPERISLHERFSGEMTPADLLEAGGAPFQFISVDGDHTMPGCLHDLRLAEATLAPGGIVAVDDIANMSCPGVVEATVRHGVTPGATLAPFALAGNKLFMTQRAHCAAYREALLAMARAGQLGAASHAILNFDAKMRSIGIPVMMLDEPILIAA
ncbi:MAG: class I SAM-dependent methyltransferase [Vicinamibacterales bacterium]